MKIRNVAILISYSLIVPLAGWLPFHPYTSSGEEAHSFKMAKEEPIISVIKPEDEIQTGTQAEDGAIATFTERVKQYVKLTEKIRQKLPRLSSESKAEKIEAHRIALEENIRVARASAKQGDIFSTDVANAFRTIMRGELKGGEKQEVKEIIFEADTKGVPLRVNYTYPDTKEMAQIPPALLLKLPEIPKQLKYRFVGRHLLLVDREAGLIIDYMLNALPK
jgi:hypothetical protein